LIVDAGELLEVETGVGQPRNDGLRVVDSMGIEHHAGPSDWQGQVEPAPRSHHPAQFSDGLPSTERIDRVAVPAEPDVFNDVEAGEGLDLLVAEWEGQHGAGPRLEIREGTGEGSDIDEGHPRNRGNAGNPADLGPDIDVLSRLVGNQVAKGPGPLVDIVGVKACRGGAVVEHRPE
jgi:hypothetical protein